MSIPDVSLLIPLAEILEVSVTELLEGRRLDSASAMKADQVEQLVKKALTLTEDTPEKQRERRKKNTMTLAGFLAFAALEMLVVLWALPDRRMDALLSGLWSLEGISAVLGIYVWVFMKERLPLYYDENQICFYSDGVFRINIPGLHFNNSNWPHIVTTLRRWSVISMVTVPAVHLLLAFLAPELPWISAATVLVYLLAMFVPLYAAGKKYE